MARLDAQTDLHYYLIGAEAGTPWSAGLPAAVGASIRRFGEAIEVEARASERARIRAILLGLVDVADWIEEDADDLFKALGLDPR